MKVALVHDWLTGMRGGEKVLELLLELFPGAPLYTLLHVKGSVSDAIESHPIHTSFVQRLPGAATRYRHYLPLFPRAIESLDLGGYEFILSSSHCVAKGVRPGAGARHLSYVHAPMRYAWDQYEAYFGDRGGLTGWALPRIMARLRAWDRRSADRAQFFLANSENVRGKLIDFWGVDAASTGVLYPPADTDFYTPAPADAEPPPEAAGEPYYLLVSAMVPYKKLDLAIAAFRGGGRRLLVLGDGPDAPRLRALAGGDRAIRFLGRGSDEDLRRLYRGARAFLMPGEEDFGITPVEAQACGTPVIALGAGGALETVAEGETGLFFTAPSADGLREALDRFERRAWDPARARAHAERFSRDAFRRGLERAVERFLGRGAAA